MLPGGRRIGQPDAETDVEQRHQEGGEAGGVIAPVRADRGAGDSEHRPQRRPPVVARPDAVRLHAGKTLRGDEGPEGLAWLRLLTWRASLQRGAATGERGRGER